MTEGTNTRQDSKLDLVAQQRLLAEFGSHALSADNLDEILGTACRMAAEGLGQTLSKIVEHRDGDLVVVASHGYDLRSEDMVLGRAGGTSAGHALEAGVPTVSGDVLADTRFERATIEQGGAVRSVLNVPIPDLLDPGAEWYGVIEVDSPECDAFSDDQVAFLRLYADLVAAAIERRDAQRRLEALVGERGRLLDELQHRVKNNLAIITGLVRLQSRKAEAPETKAHLADIGQRIETLRLLHETLYTQHSANRVALDVYLGELVENLVAFHASGTERVAFETVFEPYVVDVDRAIPLGLVINEFVTNALKYAFGDGGGRIAVSLGKHGDDAELVLSDDGVGLPEGAERSGGTGMTLIRGLAGQLGASVAWDSAGVAAGGTTLRLRFPLADLKG